MQRSELQKLGLIEALPLPRLYLNYYCLLISIQVRSNHERLVAFSGDSASKEKQKDSPLRLKSTAEWKQRGDAMHFL